ncbi:hypothetical protein BLA39750_01042 [Burkholderia lata]|uniref:Uncharacterized protein n=1 Tax=Burkholderia lata (strain ATCC 17760 / DSM 23089 / LMG 22485 / NCIMB 9086 / R18194 / 383) TaxID=482957 RepID=A0A6P2UP34_BURL3|nr:hypothetical protein [Burkholderia lata]VWC78764.1 hypothetical protein BLA39750_01042 [Burkholderia lata]
MNDQNTQPEYAGAADTLAQAREALQTRLDGVASQIYDLTAQRKSYLSSTVASLLPSISPDVLRNLQSTVAPFVSASVVEAFHTHRRFLGVFAGRGYNSTLQLLQTRLAAHLDQVKYGDLRRIDNELFELAARRNELDAQILKARDLESLMAQAARRDIAVPPSAAAAIADIARVGRAGVATGSNFERGSADRSGDTAARGGFASSSYSSSSDDSDLWLYYLTDLPLSFRTLVISSIEDHRIEEAEARQAAIDAAAATSSVESASWNPDAVSSAEASQICTPDSASADLTGGTVDAIATDDRHGLFS